VGQQLVQQRDELLEPAGPLAARDGRPEHRGVEPLPARPEADQQPPAADVVEPEHVLRERHRVPEVR
jgi:hypothetical protein